MEGAVIKAVVATPLRTAIAREGGAFKDLAPEEIGGHVINALVQRSGIDPAEVEDVVMGNQFSTMRMGRHCALLGGLSVEVPGVTINRACGSALQAILYAAQAVEGGCGDLYIAGGVESYTQAPYLLERPTEAFQRRPPRFLGADTRGDFGHPELGLDTPMGMTAENVAEQFKIAREDQDRFALLSHQRTITAARQGFFDEQIVPIKVRGAGKEMAPFLADECPRPDTTFEKLSRLPPLFKKTGTVTAGNTCKRSDAASAMIVTSLEKAKILGLEILGHVRASAVAGVHPNVMGIGPVPAVRKALKRAGLSLRDIGLIELNEAFAAQVLAVVRELDLDQDRLNVNGGAIAHGHPTGATGAILATKLLHEMRRRQAQFGMVTMCIGGGMGIAAVFEQI
ncbi:MAG: thiolase family protein [Deltaproteobacteria bacterium]|nr:thiolase family protein [Deltaproteobacteria bacterium]